MSTITWTGAVSSDPAVAGNWAGGVPASGDTVVIPASATASMAGGTVHCAVFQALAAGGLQFGTSALSVTLDYAATIFINSNSTYYLKPTLATAKTITILGTSNVTFDAASVLAASGDIINQISGTVTSQSNVATLNHAGGSHTQTAGTLAAANIYSGASLKHNSSGTITAINIYGNGTVDFSASVAKTVTTFTFYGGGGTLKDTGGVVTFTNPVKLEYCGVEDVSMSHGKHYTVAFGTI